MKENVKTENSLQKNNIDELIAEDRQRTERRKLMLQELLQEVTDKKGYVLAHSSAMGRVLVETGSPKAVPSYAATHTLGWIADNIKLAYHMPFMQSKTDPKTGKLRIDRESAADVKQRAPDWTRQPELAAYLTQPGRKFGPIIAVISPPWVDDPKHENWDSHGRALKNATEFTPLDLEGRAGLLRLEGSHLYALDGQHRVIGIQGIRDLRDKGRLPIKTKEGAEKKTVYTQEHFLELFNLSIEELQALLGETMIVEYLPAVIAGETREDASRRIRNTFVSINSYAKRTEKGENILLDESNGYAIVARKAGLFHPLFNAEDKNNRVNWKTTTIPSKRTPWYTTLATIKEMAEQYLPAVDAKRASRWDTEFGKDQIPMRPSQQDLDEAKADFFQFLDHVFALPVFQELERGDREEEKVSAQVERWREFPTPEFPDNHGHLLLRPVGQIILAKAVGKLIQPREQGGRGMNLDAVFKKLQRYDEAGGFEAHRPQNVWFGVTYDPIKDKMIMGNQSWAQDLLVYLVSGMDEPERGELWVNFVTARVVDKDEKTWRNLEGETKPFDEGRQELPAPI